MLMGIPLFLLFAVYGVVNAYLPILLFRLGYSASLIGILQGAFEAAGLLFPVFVTARVDRKGNYGVVMVALGLLMALMVPPLIHLRSFPITMLALAIFAIGYKGAVPVSDALVNRILGPESTDYGTVRVLGSIGFVCMTLLLQFTPLLDATSPTSIGIWLAIPAVLFSLSVLVIPGLLKRRPAVDAHVSEVGDEAALADASVAGAPSSEVPTTLLPRTELAAPVPSAPESSPRRRSIRQRLEVLSVFPQSYWAGIFLIFLGFLGMTPSPRFFSLYVHEYLHMDSYAGLWALSAAAEVPFMFLSGKFIRRFGTGNILLLSLVSIVLRNAVYAIFPTFGGAVVGQLFHSVSFGLFHPAAIVFVAERAPKRFMALGLTLYSSVAVGLASVLGNVMGGFVIDSLGYRALFVFFTVFPLVGVACFARLRGTLTQRN